MLLAATPSYLRAETVTYPEKDPAFSVTVPQGWKAEHEHGAVKIVAQADAIFVLQYVQNVKDENTANAALPEMAALQGKQFSLDDVKVETPAATTLMGDYK